GSTLTKEGRKELCGLLRRNLDIFAWKPSDMTGVPRHIAELRLNICEGCLPVRQNKNWLSNPVMVKKHDGSWRMCVDFKDLNKACPKDGYPLPEIDWKVESLCRSGPKLAISKVFEGRAKAKHEVGKPQQISV
ncbi:hypothetical protein Tco_0106241, partial [Tanacetum coccineum]